MIALGIDPGTTRIGYGVVDHQHGRLICLDYGILPFSRSDTLSNYKAVEKNLTALIKKHRPSVVGVEKLFFFKNQKTVMAVSEMRGVIMLTLAKQNLRVQEFTPPQVKQNISAYGKAEKNQVTRMVQLLLGIREPIRPDDAADALALAICCTNNILPV